MTILIADDDRVLTGILTTRLKQAGFEVAVAHDAMRAIMAALSNPPAAILLDFNMPGGSGLQVLRQLRNSTLTSRIPIIVVSGSLEPETEKKVRELGADDFVCKPVSCELLLGKIHQLLQRSEAGLGRSEGRPSWA
jgi:two-component system phosphate regulon response regulator PhoB